MEQKYKELIQVEAESLLLSQLMVEILEAPLSDDLTRIEVNALLLKKLNEKSAKRERLYNEISSEWNKKRA